jgi:hypothetical protein
VFRRLLCVVLAALATLALAGSSAGAAEPTHEGLQGSFRLKGTNGYEIEGWVVATGKGDAGLLLLFVSKRGEQAIYRFHGSVTREAVDFDLGGLGEVSATVQPTGKQETLTSRCTSGEPRTIEGSEYIGAISFHGEEGFTEVEAARAPLLLSPLTEIVCGTSVEGKEGGEGVSGAGLAIKRNGGPSLTLAQNRPGAAVFYSAHMNEKKGTVTVDRTVTGYLRGGAMTYAPSLATAHFLGASPFSGSATYAGRSLPRPGRPGTGPWRGNLTVDFPGHAGVPLAGPGFKASIFAVHRDRSRPVNAG